MSLKYVILGLLSNKPRSGYSLHKTFFPTVRPALSQVYRTLSDLHDAGLVNVDRLEQDKLPDQKVYSITEAGKVDLDRWLREPVTLRVGRDVTLAQLWFSSRIDKETVIQNINTYAQELRDLIKWYNTEARTLVEKGILSTPNPKDKLYWHLSLDCTLMQIEAWLKWADDAIKRISSLEPSRKKSIKKSSKARRK